VAISTGSVLAGIVGALLSVPTVAFFNNAFKVLLADDPTDAPADESEQLDELLPDTLEPDALKPERE